MIKKVRGYYFSGTGNTQKVLCKAGEELGRILKVPFEQVSFTLTTERNIPINFEKSAVNIIGTPVIAGRVPNLLLPYLNDTNGNGAPVICLVTYGNRNYDDALIELVDIMRECGGNVVAAGAFVGEHSFSDILAKGRPDEDDMRDICDMAIKTADKLKNILSSNKCSAKNNEMHSLNSSIYNDNSTCTLMYVKGRAREERGYYRPLDENGEHIDIRKVKPVTDENCDMCMWCVKNCPMGSIDETNPRNIKGICMKCCRCVKGCPKMAKRFVDRGFLYHKEDLERKYTKIRGKNEILV